MTLREYLDVARDRWRYVIGGLLIGLLLAGLVSFLMPRQYSAKVTMIAASSATADPAAAADGDAVLAQRVRTYVELMRSKRLAADVVKAMDLNITPEQLVERITVTSAPETVLLTATVIAETPERAVDTANVLAAQFISNVAELERPADPARAPLVEAKVFEPATQPAELTAPRPVEYLVIGGLLGLLIGFGVALARHGLDTTLTRRSQVESLLGVPVLGEIGRDAKAADSPLIIYGDPQAPVAEEYRQLRTNVQFTDVDTSNKIILVTSGSSGEGKTTTVCNLGLALAEAGVSVLIIDADLRRSSVARYLGVDGTIGLTNVLVNQVPIERAVQPLAPSLDLLPSGLMPPNPSELLGSQRMGALLQELRRSYDMILIDSSPLLPVTDAAVLAPRADGALLMVRHGKTKLPELEAAKESLAAVSARILGAVLSMSPTAGKLRYPSTGTVTNWKQQRPPAGDSAAAPRPQGSPPQPPTQQTRVVSDPRQDPRASGPRQGDPRAGSAPRPGPAQPMGAPTGAPGRPAPRPAPGQQRPQQAPPGQLVERGGGPAPR